MNINFSEYKDKVYACWVGKNIGGTMGTPYEGKREYLDIKGFATKKGEVLPNDDLDLQLVWLLALEQIGPYNINASTLGEYWLSFITPHWNEYGLGKLNMKRGLIPPLAGDYLNHWNNSNGAWIRTEIWASITPGAPAASANYAIEDAKVDHGAGEGTFAAAFVAAMQSAAFVLKDIRQCIEVGVAAIPENCRVASSVRYVLDAYDKGVSHKDCRNGVQQLNADIGDGWFEAPSNVAYTVIGLIYGEGDFKKSMIAAINCGDDTDCTGATLGATLGILNGMDGIPKDWMEYLGDDIITLSIARGNNARNLPDTCTALTERVVKVAPVALFANKTLTDMTVDKVDPTSYPVDIYEKLLAKANAVRGQFSKLKPYMTHFDTVPFSADVTLSASPDISPLGEIGVHIDFDGNVPRHENSPYNLTLRWILPEGFTAEGGKLAVRLDEASPHGPAYAYTDFVIKAGETVSAVNRLVLEVIPEGRHTAMYIPIILLG
ncbi:MAG: ADP-ribosylglycohydrolase family protein [Clostridia bacterium]|nr:ADP-ribosylglycohydrolase family protein [Clostridia bacterium]